MKFNSLMQIRSQLIKVFPIYRELYLVDILLELFHYCQPRGRQKTTLQSDSTLYTFNVNYVYIIPKGRGNCKSVASQFPYTYPARDTTYTLPSCRAVCV